MADTHAKRDGEAGRYHITIAKIDVRLPSGTFSRPVVTETVMARAPALSNLNIAPWRMPSHGTRDLTPRNDPASCGVSKSDKELSNRHKIMRALCLQRRPGHAVSSQAGKKS
jgi:hypothetical protein